MSEAEPVESIYFPIKYPTLPSHERFKAMIQGNGIHRWSQLKGNYFQLAVDDFLPHLFPGDLILEEWKTSELLRRIRPQNSNLIRVGKSDFRVKSLIGTTQLAIPDDMVFRQVLPDSFILKHIIETSLLSTGHFKKRPVEDLLKFFENEQGQKLLTQLLQLQLGSPSAKAVGIERSKDLFVKVLTQDGARKFKRFTELSPDEDPPIIHVLPLSRQNLEDMAFRVVEEVWGSDFTLSNESRT